MHPKLRRIDLDLGYREARRYVFRVGDLSLVLREPSFSHIEVCKAIQGLDPASQELIQFLEWRTEDLPDIMDLCSELPMHATVRLVTTCREVFECAEDIEFEDFKFLQQPIGTGRLRAMSAQAIQNWKSQREDKVLMNLLERLGVIVKPRPVQEQASEEAQAPRDIAWLPLTAAFNPSGFRKVQDSLSYNPETWEEEQESRNKIQDLDNPDKRDREFGGAGDTKRELTVRALSGDSGVSLTMLPKQQYAALIKSTSVGFVAAHDQGIDLKTYRAAVERNMNPKLLAERGVPEPPQDSDLQKLEESQDGTVTVRSRWRSRT